MLQIDIDKISFKYETGTDYIFENISAKIYKGDKVALIGNNGCGKTTFIKTLCGINKPEHGTIRIADGIKMSYIPQENICGEFTSSIEFILAQNHNLLDIYRKIKTGNDEQLGELYSEYALLDGFDIEAEIEKKRELFGFDADFYNKNPQNFSGGEKMKLALLKSITAKPDIIFMDEPTNHLDYSAILWLENFIKGSNLTILTVSHDRSFIDNSFTSLWELSRDNLKIVNGNYSSYEKTEEILFESSEKAYKEKKKSMKKLKRAVQDQKAHAEKNEKFKPSRSRKKNGAFCQIDVGSKQSVREQNLMKGAKAIDKRIDDIKKDIGEIKNRKRSEIRMILAEGNVKNRFIVTAENISKSFADKRVFENISIAVKNGEKIAVMGKNGCGKSTFLKIVAGRLNADSGNVKIAPMAKINYFEQDFDYFKKDETVIDFLTEGNSMLESEARTILAALNVNREKHFMKTRMLSAGEKSKVAITKMLIERNDLILLDEPLSHLEISARKALENALLNYSGTVICITHDKTFAENFADRIFNMD